MESLKKEHLSGIQHCPPLQYVWVYCKEETHVEDVLSICRKSKRPQIIPEIVDLPGSAHESLCQSLKLVFKSLPPPYSLHEWEEFAHDVEALLAASNKRRQMVNIQRWTVKDKLKRGDSCLKELQAMRWPELLVTDRDKFCKACSKGVRFVLAEFARLRMGDLLPVVSASDFGKLTGNVTEAEDLPLMRSLVLPSDVLPLQEPMSTELVDVPLGVYLQSHSRVGKVPRDTAENDSSESRYGARCLALFGDGSCAYASISPDGSRGVEASGSWEVINGQVVVGGSKGHAAVRHMQFSHNSVFLVQGISYAEPVHISLTSLRKEFEPPRTLAECLPGAGESLKLAFQDANPGEADTLRMSRSPELQAMTHDTNLGATAKSEKPQSDLSVETMLPDTVCLSTVQHALLKLVRDLEVSKAPLIQDSLGPRLLGFQRGITQSAVWGESGPIMLGRPSSAVGARQLAIAADSAKQLPAAVPPLSRERKLEDVRQLALCPIKPGIYSCETGGPGTCDYQRMRMTLHADGSCQYSENTKSCVLKSTQAPARWRVQNGSLLLGASERGTYSFVFSKSAGSRFIQHRVACVELLVEHVLKMCTFEAFQQEFTPFPGHMPAAASQQVFGVINVRSPVLHGMKYRPDRLPFHAFQNELRKHDLSIDEILSDFDFIDRDEDGQISVAEMQTLESFGCPVAAPEVLHELRMALTEAFGGSLANAFEAITGGTPKMTGAQLETFFKEAACGVSSHGTLATGKPKGSSAPVASKAAQRLMSWLSSVTAEDRAAVFASLSLVQRGEAIDVQDFLALGLYTAILSVRRVEHFKTWIFEQFGSTKEVFRHVFNAMDVEKNGMATRRLFADGAASLGYPCNPQVLRSIFSLLDRNFDGEVTFKDFLKLKDFDGEQLLMGMEALKRFVEDTFGSMDQAYEHFLRKERAQHVSNYSATSTVSYTTFERALAHAGFKKKCPDVDLRMIFLFLDEATGKHADGFLSADEWSLMTGLDSQALVGNPARLRKLLISKYGSINQAFESIHTDWLSRSLANGLKQLALSGLARAIDEGSHASPTGAQCRPVRPRGTGVVALARSLSHPALSLR